MARKKQELPSQLTGRENEERSGLLALSLALSVQ